MAKNKGFLKHDTCKFSSFISTAVAFIQPDCLLYCQPEPFGRHWFGRVAGQGLRPCVTEYQSRLYGAF
jgi:hypothetical protein